MAHHFVSVISTPFTFDLGSCISNLNKSTPIGYPSCHLWSFRWFIWSWWISQWLVTWVLCFQVSLCVVLCVQWNSSQCWPFLKYSWPIMSAFLASIYNVGSRSATKLYHPIDLIFVLDDVGCINSLILMCLLLSTPHHHVGNGSRNPSEYLGSCSHQW